MTIFSLTTRSILALIPIGLAPTAQALTPLSEGELSSVAGQDGISLQGNITSPDIRSISWSADSSTVQANNMAIQNVDGSSPYSGIAF